MDLAPEKSTKQQSSMTEGSVDADPSSSSSTQMQPSMTTTSSALQKHGVKRPDLTQLANSSNDFQSHDDVFTFSAYRSPFDSYPRLRGHPQRLPSDPFSISYDFSSIPSSHMYQPTVSSVSSDLRSASTKISPSSSSFSSSTGIPLPDLKPLKLTAMIKSFDPTKRICRYEIPGGGTCRDEHCEDIHLSRLENANEMGAVEPSGSYLLCLSSLLASYLHSLDEDAAQYLFDTLPNSWLTQHRVNSPSKLLAALKQVHHRTLNNPLSFEERVAHALFSIGSPPAP
ncbi:hypothetical protein BDN70DRAFT_458282 [Pholiota conissans]|uniref:Zinc-finger domain-containing protein n=1 Tax=Pholiota conissans TaxID=109636 RepID=A0A9P5ZER2_9AGAR|nr:hypothetical protein BDN70DRAFT_458282 [Pholiota conissans]